MTGRQRASGAERRPGALPLIGAGPLWAWFGVTEFLRPWGAPTRYDADRGYDVVLDRGLYWLSAGPGSVALVLTAAGLVLALEGRSAPGAGRPARWLAASACAAGGLSLVGVVTSFDPVATAARLLGFVLLGTATALAARGGRCGGPVSPRLLLGVVAVLTLFLVPLWPLVYAVGMVPGAGAALVFALAGAGWVAVALTSRRPVRTGDLTRQGARPVADA